MPVFPFMWGGYWENANLYWTQGTRQSLSWWEMELIGHQPEVLTGWASAQQWHLDHNEGGSIISGGNNCLSVSPESPVLPVPQGMWHEPISHVWRSASWSFQTTYHQSLQEQGPFQAAFSTRVSYHLSGWFTQQHWPTGPPSEGSRGKSVPAQRQARQTTANGTSVFRVGWGGKDWSS